jgi:hypothetical protein
MDVLQIKPTKSSFFFLATERRRGVIAKITSMKLRVTSGSDNRCTPIQLMQSYALPMTCCRTRA